VGFCGKSCLESGEGKTPIKNCEILGRGRAYTQGWEGGVKKMISSGQHMSVHESFVETIPKEIVPSKKNEVHTPPEGRIGPLSRVRNKKGGGVHKKLR